MKPHWTEQRSALQYWLLMSPRILIGCDFDGTLAPIVAHADDARLPASTREVLQRLIAMTGVTLAFISGRSLADLQQRIGLPGALYAGNHGLEMTGQGGSVTLAPGVLESLPAMCEVQNGLTSLLNPIQGVWIEDKGLTLSVHYRLAEHSRHAEIERLVRHAVSENKHLIVKPAKCIWEIRPVVDWDKGTALRQFMQHQQVPAGATAFLGDDITDGDAFRELPDGWTFFVGEDESVAARLWVRDVQDCAALLVWMAEVRAAARVLR
ncbi:MAG: trehalose-phosphatase [Prosthecobacter sp.]|uniref:trehalose-phosphatase n=1 Tax=Prosthecobacter sp. TaxID=1965333 RepID=UPI003BB0F557